MMRRDGFGAVDGAALVVASVVGAGIFTVPAYVASQAGSAATVIVLWIAGGALALAGALCYAELAMRFARGGAEYVYLREAFGEVVGFLSGWTSFIAGFSGAIAASAVAFAAHATSHFSTDRLPTAVFAAGPLAFSISPTTLIAITIIMIFTVVSMAGVGASRLATNGLALVIVIGIAIMTLTALFARVDLPASSPSRSGTTALAALVPIFFTYSGWNAAAYVAGEFRDRSAIKRSLIWGTVLVTVLYVGLNVGLLRSLSFSALGASETPVANAAAILFGGPGRILTSTLILSALASSVCALVITGPRIYKEMARDGALPGMFATTAKRTQVPTTAAIAQSLWSVLLVLTGTFGQIVTYTGFSILLFSGAAVASLIVLRRRSGKPAGFAVPGYPVLPLAFIAAVALIAISSFRYAPGPSLLGVAMIAAGVPLYGITRLMRVRRLAASPG